MKNRIKGGACVVEVTENFDPIINRDTSRRAPCESRVVIESLHDGQKLLVATTREGALALAEALCEAAKQLPCLDPYFPEEVE